MKKIAFLIFVFSLVHYPLIGQHVSFGIKSSFINSNAKFIEISDFPKLEPGSRRSFSFGFTGKMNLSKYLFMQIEPRFIEKGYNIEWGINDFDIYKNGYFSLATIVKIVPIKKLNIEIGPEVSYLIYSKTGNNNASLHSNKNPDLNSFELTFITGLSYNVLKKLI